MPFPEAEVAQLLADCKRHCCVGVDRGCIYITFTHVPMATARSHRSRWFQLAHIGDATLFRSVASITEAGDRLWSELEECADLGHRRHSDPDADDADDQPPMPVRGMEEERRQEDHDAEREQHEKPPQLPRPGEECYAPQHY
jgi:hypothetical protein